MPNYPTVMVFVVGPDGPLRRAALRALDGRPVTAIIYQDVAAATREVDEHVPALVLLVGPAAASAASVRELLPADGVVWTLTEDASLDDAGDRHFTSPESTDLAAPLDALMPFTYDAAQARRKDAINSLAELALTGAPVDDVLDYAVHATARALDVEFCSVRELRPDTHELVLRAGVGWTDEDPANVTIPSVASQTGYALETGVPVVVEDLDLEDRFEPSDFLREHDIRSGASVIISGVETPYGVLSIHSKHPRAFSQDDVHALVIISSILTGTFARRRAEAALEEMEARSRAILRTTVDAIITIDERGHIETFNQAAERIFGYDADEVIGKNVKVLMPEPYRSEHDSYMHSYHETGRRKIIGIGREVTGRRKDGTVFPMDLAVSEVQLHNRTIFTGIIRDITERRRLEQEVLATSEQERRRIGQDLHDGLGQMLTGVHLISRNLARQLEASDHNAAESVAEIAELVKEADQYARGLARGLVPVELEQGGLLGALERLAANAQRLFGITCSFEKRGPASIEDTTIGMHLYRIAQESVSNAVRHGKAETVRITLAAGRDQLRLRIRDDGRGFTEADVLGVRTDPEERRGMGVRIMHYRARIIGASLDIQGAAGEGTTITCTLRRHGETPARSIKPQLHDGIGSLADYQE